MAYVEYQHIKIGLSEILAELDELGITSTRMLLRVKPDATVESLKQQVGEIQGIEAARRKLEHVFGAR